MIFKKDKREKCYFCGKKKDYNFLKAKKIGMDGKKHVWICKVNCLKK